MTGGTIDTVLRACVPDPVTFRQEHWGQRPQLRRHAEGGPSAARLLTAAELDRLLTSCGLRHPAFQVVRDGRYVPPDEFTNSSSIDLGRVARLYHQGCTLVANRIEQYVPPIAAVCSGLEDVFQFTVDANIYMTPAQTPGLRPHWDQQDVFIVQTAGRKRWALWKPVVQYPVSGGHVPGEKLGTPALEAVLDEGDCLYVPRGFVHAATAADQHSVHVTLTVNPITWIDVACAAIGRLVDSRELRAAAAPEIPEALRTHFQDLPLECGLQEVAVSAYWRRPIRSNGFVADMLSTVPINESDLVVANPTARLRISSQHGANVTAELNGRELHLSSSVLSALGPLFADNIPVRVSALTDRCAATELVPCLEELRVLGALRVLRPRRTEEADEEEGS